MLNKTISMYIDSVLC